MTGAEDRSAKKALHRTISFIEDDETKEDMSPKFNTVSPNLLSRWRTLRRTISAPKQEESFSSGGIDECVFAESLEEPDNEEELSITVCKDLIRQSLFDYMKSQKGNVQLLSDLELDGRITADNVNHIFQGSTPFEKNVAFLMACFLKRKDLTTFFLTEKINIDFYDPRLGFGAMHLSAFSGCIDCTGYLINNGADTNRLLGTYTPLHCAAFGNSPNTAKLLLKSGAKSSVVGAGSERLGSNETVLHSAVRANALECVQLFIEENLDLNNMAGSGSSPLHLAADFGYIQCVKLLLDSKRCDVNQQTTPRLNTALHLAAEGGFVECVELLLAHGANPNVQNYRLQTPLHLAAKVCVDCVEILLRHGANPNCRDVDSRTPLHVAVCKIDFAFGVDVINRLQRYKADLNAADGYGYTPLHIAALNELPECVEKLILLGADVSAKTRGGSTALSIVSRKTPWVLPAINRVLDESITIGDKHTPSKSISLKFNFKYLIQHSGKYETALLEAFEAAGMKQLLGHPLCEAFLYLKWNKLRKFYILKLAICLLFIVLLSFHVLAALAYECYNDSLMPEVMVRALNNQTSLCDPSSTLGHILRTYPSIIRTLWFTLAGLAVLEIIRKGFGVWGYNSFKEYAHSVHNLSEWFVIVSVFLVSFIFDGQTHKWQNHVGAVAVLCGWINFMVMVGYLPTFGTYVLMFTTVLCEFLKLFAAFFCLFIGFTICFCVMFPLGQEFSNPLVAFVKITAMMTGEVDFEGLLENVQAEGSDLLRVSALVVFVFFMIFMTIVLMNLLIGITVHDIHGLRKAADLEKLVIRTQVISRIERAFFTGALPRCFFKMLRVSASIFPSGYGMVLCVRPHNPRETRLPRKVMRQGLGLATRRAQAGCRGDVRSVYSKHHDHDKDNLARMQDITFMLGKLTAEIERLKEDLTEN